MHHATVNGFEFDGRGSSARLSKAVNIHSTSCFGIDRKSLLTDDLERILYNFDIP